MVPPLSSSLGTTVATADGRSPRHNTKPDARFHMPASVGRLFRWTSALTDAPAMTGFTPSGVRLPWPACGISVLHDVEDVDIWMAGSCSQVGLVFGAAESETARGTLLRRLGSETLPYRLAPLRKLASSDP